MYVSQSVASRLIVPCVEVEPEVVLLPVLKATAATCPAGQPANSIPASGFHFDIFPKKHAVLFYLCVVFFFPWTVDLPSKQNSLAASMPLLHVIIWNRLGLHSAHPVAPMPVSAESAEQAWAHRSPWA